MSRSKKKSISLFFLIPVFLFIAFSTLTISLRNSSVYSCCGKPILSENFDFDSKIASIDGTKVDIPSWVFKDNFKQVKNAVLGSTNDEKRIEIDLSEQKLRAWEGSTLFLESLVSTGLPWFPTPQGEFRIWAKVRATKMEGGQGRYYYNLPNVPFVMFFENEKVPGYRGYSLHGTYWHNDFGKVHSHGCVNLPIPIAEKLYYWTTPDVPEGKFYMRASTENLGTRISIHE